MNVLTLVTLALGVTASAARASMAGGVRAIAPEDLAGPGIASAAAAVAAKFDATSDFAFATSARAISGTQQVVAGMRYELTVELRATPCARGGAAAPGAVCAPTGAPLRVVHAAVWAQPWRGSNEVTIASVDVV